MALLLGAAPFFYSLYVQPRQKKSKMWKNLFSLISAAMPWAKKIKNKASKFLHRLRSGMCRHDSFRKFFMLMIFLIMTAFQWVDYSSSNSILELYQTERTAMMADGNWAEGGLQNFLFVYSGLWTAPIATLLSFAIAFMFFFYKPTNWLLTTLHEHKKCYHFTGLFCIALIYWKPQFLITGEIIYIVMIAAYLYPSKVQCGEPDGGRRIFFNDNLRKAA